VPEIACSFIYNTVYTKYIYTYRLFVHIRDPLTGAKPFLASD